MNFFLLLMAFFVLAVAIWLSLPYARESCLLLHQWCGQDMDQYSDYSTNMMEGKGFSSHAVANMYYVDIRTRSVYVPEIQRLPAYSVLLSFGRMIHNDSQIVLVYNYLFFGMIVLYTYLIARVFLHPLFALITTVLTALHPMLFFYTAISSGVDTFSGAMLLGSVYHVYKVAKGQRRSSVLFHGVIACVFGVLGTFSRQNVVYFLLPFLSLTLFAIWRLSSFHTLFKKTTQHFRYRTLATAIILILLCIGAWSTRNFLVAGKFTLSAAVGSQIFTEHIYFTPVPNEVTMGLHRWYYGWEVGRKFMEEEEQRGVPIARAFVHLDDYLLRIMRSYIIHNPHQVWRHYQRAILAFYSGNTFTWVKTDYLFAVKSFYAAGSMIFMVGSWLIPTGILISLVSMKSQNPDLENRERRFFYSILLLIIWFSAMVMMAVSAFAHGVVIGERGILPIWSLFIIGEAFLLQEVLTLTFRWSRMKFAPRVKQT